MYLLSPKPDSKQRQFLSFFVSYISLDLKLKFQGYHNSVRQKERNIESFPT